MAIKRRSSSPQIVLPQHEHRKSSDESRKEDAIARKATLEADNIEQDITLRKTFSSRIFLFMCLWMAFIGVLISIQPLYSSPLSDNVLIALIGGATIKVLGIFFAVVKYLFDHK